MAQETLGHRHSRRPQKNRMLWRPTADLSNSNAWAEPNQPATSRRARAQRGQRCGRQWVNEQMSPQTAF
jgi:hypothetical protein